MKASEKKQHLTAILVAAILLILGAAGLRHLLLQATPSMLDRIRDAGTLIVATRRSPTVYHPGVQGPDGFEYALTQRFAEALDISVAYRFPASLEELIDATARAEVHLSAAGLTATPSRTEKLDFSEPYQFVTEQLIYRRGSKRPKSLDDIGPGQLHVVQRSSHDETLSALKDKHPALDWVRHSDIGSERLLSAVDRGELAFTIADSNDAALNRRVYPHVAVAFELGDPLPIAWAFAKTGDGSLRAAANRFLQSLEHNGELRQLRAQYFGHTGRLDFVDVREFWRHVRDRLPNLRPYFEEAARITGIDWRLLAAVGYQESHWNKDAVSPTGVRGIMMLTRDTAKQMGVRDRRNPGQSIVGGARYLRVVEKKIPERIDETNRLWLTLAGYNIGFGHLEDARILTQRDGASPDLWLEVKKRLPLLSKKKYHATVKYGYARGGEPVHYVDNIRNYFDLLVWFTTTDDIATRDHLVAPESNRG